MFLTNIKNEPGSSIAIHKHTYILSSKSKAYKIIYILVKI